MMDATDKSPLANLGKELRLSDFSTSRNNRIGQVFPHHCQKAADRLASLALEYDRPPDMNHGVPPTSKPIDIGHVVEFDGDDRIIHERKAIRDMPLKGRRLSQEACADERFMRATGRIGVCFGRDLSRARGWPEMRRHPIDTPTLELIWHRSSSTHEFGARLRSSRRSATMLSRVPKCTRALAKGHKCAATIKMREQRQSG